MFTQIMSTPMWVNVLVKASIKKYMLLTDADIGDGDTYCLADLEEDGWERFADFHKRYQDAKAFMSQFYPEYSELHYMPVPVTFREACAFVNEHHRHHVSPQGHKFSLALSDGADIVAVAIVGRPVSRVQDDRMTCEVTRMCAKPGYKNACSLLYAKACRVAKELGYQRVLTYTLMEESGASLRSAGFHEVGSSPGGSWGNAKRPRHDKHPTGPKRVWEYRVS